VRIAILSDIHDNVWNLSQALKFLNDNDIDGLFCCGDLCSPFVVSLLADGLPDTPIHIVLGNNDGDPLRIKSNADKYKDIVSLYGELAEIEIDYKKFAVIHFSNIAQSIAESGRFDVVCCGHNHMYKVDRVGESLLINPGAIMGYDGINKKEIPPTFVIYETRDNSYTGFEIKSNSGRENKKIVVLDKKV